MISKLVKLADQLDSKGKSNLADLVDHAIKCIVAGKDEPTDEEVEQLWEDENNAQDEESLKPGEKECDECEKHLPLSVLHSPAGFYLGHFCYKCGPKGKHSFQFFKTIKEAEEELKKALK